MHKGDRTRRAVALAAAISCGAASAQRMERGAPLADVRRSTDVSWLERVALSPASAHDRQSDDSKERRVAAYARLGEIGSRDSLAAVGRIERERAALPLTPATVPLDQWPSVSWHTGDLDWRSSDAEFVASESRDGLTYAVVSADVLGGTDLFLIATRTPGDRASWSRPKLVAPDPGGLNWANATLAWRGPRTLLLTAGRGSVQIALDDVERDSDGDGWTDLEEARIGINPQSVDTDGDGIPDGRDVCPLYAKPAGEDDGSQILQTAVFAAFAMTGSRQLLYVTPQTPRVHLSGYGGPVIYGRAIPKSGDGNGAIYVSWKIVSRTENDAIVELTDWEGMLAAGGQDVTLKRTAGRWVVVAVRSTWVS